MNYEFWITSHVVLDLKEVLAVIAALEPRYRRIAALQYGAGLRLKGLAKDTRHRSTEGMPESYGFSDSAG